MSRVESLPEACGRDLSGGSPRTVPASWKPRCSCYFFVYLAVVSLVRRFRLPQG